MSATTLHPRYQGIWEQPDADYPDEHPKDWVHPERHDFSDRRWLTPEHRAALDLGGLDVPERTQMDHVAVLVSVPQSVTGEPVSWIDRGMAEVVLLAHRAGLNVRECCEDGEGGPTLYFAARSDMRAFCAAASLSRRVGGLAEYARSVRWHNWPVVIASSDMDHVTARLREAAL